MNGRIPGIRGYGWMRRGWRRSVNIYVRMMITAAGALLREIGHSVAG